MIGELLNKLLLRKGHLKTNRFLYKYKSYNYNCWNLNDKYLIKVFSPSILNLQEHRNFSLIYLIWYISTKGGYKIFYVLNSNNIIIHYSHAIPRFWKFKFMEENDYEIGPCWTDCKYRGQGIYPYVIQYAVDLLKGSFNSFYMMVDSNNISSIKGIEKSGFIKVGNVKKSKVFGIHSSIID